MSNDQNLPGSAAWIFEALRYTLGLPGHACARHIGVVEFGNDCLALLEAAAR